MRSHTKSGSTLVITEKEPINIVGYLRADTDLCRGCRCCEVACAWHKERECNPRLSAIRVKVDNENAEFTPIFCVQCQSAPCARSCPAKAIIRDQKSGALFVDRQKCTGCGVCIEVCPIGAIWLNPNNEYAIKCDLCGGEPKCVEACKHGALNFFGGI